MFVTIVLAKTVSHAENKVSVENRGKIIIALIYRGARKLANDSVASEQGFASVPPEEMMLAGRDSMTQKICDSRQ